MPTRETEHVGIGEAVGEVADHAKTIANLEVRLALAELKEKVAALAVGIGAAVIAGVLLLFVPGFGAATVAAALELVLPTWLSLLIVTLLFLLVAGALGAVAYMAFRRGTPPVPQQAIEEAKLTTEALKRDGHPDAGPSADTA
jgi:protein-S-isoprenylcysteine O-methyltransferase Ste14